MMATAAPEDIHTPDDEHETQSAGGSACTQAREDAAKPFEYAAAGNVAGDSDRHMAIMAQQGISLQQ